MSLAQLLGDQQTRLGSLNQLLEEEMELLTAGDIDGRRLERIAANKQALLGELERVEMLRRKVQGRLGYANDLQGASDAARDAGCLGAWNAMQALTERTARLNALAGQLLSLRLSHNQRMLDFIHDVAEKTLYDPRGKAGNQPGRLNASA